MNISANKKLFVLDTNVLMHDPAALFHFQEHNIFIPMIVLEELDHGKRGVTEVARNVRQVSRFIDDLLKDTDRDDIKEGLPLSQLQSSGQKESALDGRLFFQTRQMTTELPASMPGSLADNSILSIVLALAKEYPDTQVILVSKDINMRIKAAALEIKAEDYHSDQTLDDIDLLYSGSTALPEDFWETHGTKMESWIEDGHTYYKLEGPLVESWFPGQYLYIENGSDSDFEAIVRSIDNETATLELAKNYREGHHMTWGINAKNREQNFALNVLMDPEIDFVTLLGTAGTGKTLLALAAGLAQTMDDKTYKEIIMTRETVPVGEDIGFLPGTEEEKMTPWMGALIDNLELLGDQTENSDWEQNVTKTIVMNKIKIRSLNFMRGRTFLIRYIIIDEAQNLTPKQMKTLITRAGPGTKIVCIGNLSQIDTPYLTATSSGLTYVVDKFKSWEHAAHITLKRGERSRLADHASEIL
jgi:PhoH-like ATPase